MGNEISKVYQFISSFGSVENWKNEIDEKYGNGDGIILKTEFRNFMLNEFGFESDDNKNDIINKFWASIDTKTSGKIGSTGVSNKNALDCEELARAEEAVKATNIINDFVSKQTVPSGISNVDNWKNSVKESLLNKALDFLKKNKEAKAECWDIEAAFQATNRQTTADYVAKETIQEKLGDIEGYDADKDKALSKVVDSYVRSLSDETETSIDSIVTHVKELVSAYADTAETNSAESIEKLGSSYNANGNLNDLQVAVLIRDITTEIQNGLKSSKAELYNSYQSFIDAKIPGFVKSQLQGVKASDFSKTKSSGADYLEKFMSTELVDIEKEYNELQDAKKELKEILSGKYADKYKAALKELFNTDSQSEIEAIIDGYNTLAEVTEMKAKVETKIDEVDSQVDESFFSALKDVTIGFGESQSIVLPNATEKYSTNELSYQVENGGGNISVDSSGCVTIKGAQIGTYRNVKVSVYANGKKIGTSNPITIIVTEDAKTIVNRASSWNGQVSKDLGLIKITGDDSCSIDNTLSNTSFKDLYNNDEIVRLHISMDDSESWDSAGNTINSRLEQLGNLIYSALSTTGLDASILQTAMSNVIQGYQNNKFAAGCLNDDDDGGSEYD